MRRFFHSALVATAAVVLFIFYDPETSNRLAVILWSSEKRSLRLVNLQERAIWRSDATLKDSVEPVLFSLNASHDALAALPCLKYWSPQRLRELGSGVTISAWKQHRREGQSTAEFVLARGREADFFASQAVSSLNETLADFFASSAQNGAATAHHQLHYHYHSGPLEAWGDGIAADAHGLLEALSMHDAPSDVPAESWPFPSGPMVWVGHAGVVATPHYDKSLNLVLQVFGTKRWTLWAPSEVREQRDERAIEALVSSSSQVDDTTLHLCTFLVARRLTLAVRPLQLASLRLHPATHPSRRQARVPFTDAGSDGPYASTQAMRVEMVPGDLLFVPPFWTHAVESTSDALSLSVISPSWVEAVGARISWGGLPFGRVPNRPTSRARALGRYLRVLVPRVLGEPAQSFLRSVFHSRHAEVNLRGRPPCGEHQSISTDRRSEQSHHAPCPRPLAGDVAAAACTSLLHLQTAEARRAGRPTGGDAAEAADTDENGAQPTAEEIRGAVDAVQKVVEWRDQGGLSSAAASSPPRRLDGSVVRELVSGYVEELAAWAVGTQSHSQLLAAWATCGAASSVDGGRGG